MQIKSCLVGLALLPLILFSGEDALQLQCIPPPNLLRNADFSQVDEKRLPCEWQFDNCSRSPNFRSQIISHPSGNYLAVNTEWIKFGYWLQNVPVKEGVSYYVSCEVQSDAPALAIWLICKTTKESNIKSPGKTEYLFPRSLRFSDDLKEMLKDFVDEELITNLSSKNWNRIHSEIVIPSDRGIKECAMRIGIYGGNAGQGRYRNPVFREAQSELKAEISGTGWTELRIPDAKPEIVKLDPTLEKQLVSVILPKAKHLYKVELHGQESCKLTKEIANE